MDEMSESFYFYVLYCKDQTLYAGFTTDLEQRLHTHNSGKGAKYTKVSKRRPVKMIYAEAWATKSLAMKQEYWFKQLTRRQKEAYLKSAGLTSLTESSMLIVNRTHEKGEHDDSSSKELPS